MKRDSLVAAARGDTVTADRLTDAVLASLDDEQPHHLLRALSVDVEADDEDRIYPSTDASAWVVATDDRLLFVVPQSLSSVVETVQYDEITATNASTTVDSGVFAAVTVGATYRAHLDAGEDPEPLREFVEGATTGETDDPTPLDVSLDETVEMADSTSDDAATTGRSDDTSPPESPSDADDTDGTEDPLETIRRLDQLREDGIIGEEEFERKKQKLLDEI